MSAIQTVQSGLPFTPQLGFNPTNNGDSGTRSGLPGIRLTRGTCLGLAESVLQSICFCGAGKRNLRQRRTRHVDRSGDRFARSIGIEDDGTYRESQAAVPCGVFQCAESCRFQHPESGSVYFGLVDCIADSGRDHGDVDDVAADSVRGEATVLGGEVGRLYKRYPRGLTGGLLCPANEKFE